jgi:hypothetical protein
LEWRQQYGSFLYYAGMFENLASNIHPCQQNVRTIRPIFTFSSLVKYIHYRIFGTTHPVEVINISDDCEELPASFFEVEGFRRVVNYSER